MSSSVDQDSREAVLVEAIDGVLASRTIVESARALPDPRAFRRAVERRYDDVWQFVEPDLTRWLSQRDERAQIEARIIDQLGRPILQPQGILQRLNALGLDKSPEGLRMHFARYLRNNQAYNEAKEAESRARQALTRSLVEQCILPAVREILNQHISEDFSNNSLGGDGSGLDQLIPNDFELRSLAGARLSRFLNGMTTASIGVAGPRGSGKTTLLNWYCGPTARHANYSLRVLVTAPVKYEARDYLLYVLITLCKTILGDDDSLVASENKSGPGRLPSIRPVFVRLTICAIGVVAGIAFLMSAAAPLLSRISIPPELAPLPGVTVKLPTTTGPTVLVVGQLLILYLGVRTLHRRAILPLRRAIESSVGGHVSILSRLVKASNAAQGATIIAAAGAIYLGVQGVRQPKLDDLNSLLTAFAGLALVYVFGSRSKREGLDYRTDNLHRINRMFGPGSVAHNPVAAEARSKLARALFQKAVSSSNADTVTLSASLGLSASVGTTVTSGESLTSIPWTRPELVHEIRELLGNYAATVGPAIVGIDELDKIASSGDAANFIDDIKGVFGVPGCHFLVAVSEDALSDFERRGMPLRSAFDSAFDDVISMDYFSLQESRDLLRTRVVGIPIRFVGLCHALSGGLPRDLIRVARRLYAYGRNVDLETAARRLAYTELSSKVKLLAGGIAPIHPSTWAEPIVRISDQIVSEGDRESVRPHASALISHISAIELDAGIVSSEERSALRLCVELQAFAYFCVTVVDACGARSDFLEESPEEVVAALEELGRARQGFAIHPELAKVRVVSLRGEVGLEFLG